MTTNLLPQLTKSSILWFLLDSWPLKIFAPTWTQLYFFRNASSSTDISSAECKKCPKCIFVILWEKPFCAQISFVFHCFLTSSFVHKNVNTLSWDLYYDSKCVILHFLSISTTNLISPKMSLTTFLHSHDDILNEVKTPWIFVGASNSGHSMIAYLLRQLTKSNILWFVLDLWPLKILAPTWTQIYFSTNASSSTEINLMKWKHHECLLAQRAVNTLKVHVVLHEPLSGLLCTVHWH